MGRWGVLQRGMRKLWGVMDMLLILIVMMFHGCIRMSALINRVHCMYVEFNICLLYHMYNKRGKYCLTTVNRNQLSLAIDSKYLEK